MRRTGGAPLLLALAVALGTVAAGCEGDQTVVEDDGNGGTVEEGDDGGTEGGEDTGDGGDDSGDGGDDSGDGGEGEGGDDTDLDVDVG